MTDYIPIIWILSALSIPIILIIISIKNLYKEVNYEEVLAALFFSLLFYLPVTFIVALSILMIEPTPSNTVVVNSTPVWNPSSGLDTDYKIFFGYIIFGLFLFWFMDRGFLKILKFMNKADLTLIKIK